jgi:hypothetical protein
MPAWDFLDLTSAPSREAWVAAWSRSVVAAWLPTAAWGAVRPSGSCGYGMAVPPVAGGAAPQCLNLRVGKVKNLWIRGCGRRYNYRTNLPFISLIRANKLLRNQEESKSTPTTVKELINRIFTPLKNTADITDTIQINAEPRYKCVVTDKTEIVAIHGELASYAP